MYTIKQAAQLTGVSEASLRAWERRYGVVIPRRSEAGYRIYDKEAVASVMAMRRLVDAGWSPVQAAGAVREGRVPPATEPSELGEWGPDDQRTYPFDSMEEFLSSAARMDPLGIERSLDRGFALGSFERVVDAWLCPALVALGEGWARGEIDVAGEHLASHALRRRLAAAFEAAGSQSRGPKVVVGLPPGSHHELGALAFATAIKRRGINAVYLGANVPESSWNAAVSNRQVHAAVLAVVTAADRRSAVKTIEGMRAGNPDLLVACGGAFGSHLGPGVHSLARPISQAAQEIDSLIPGDSMARR